MTVRHAGPRWFMTAALVSAAVTAACDGKTGHTTDAASVVPPATSVESATEGWPAPPAIRNGDHVFAGGMAPPGATMHNPFTDDPDAAALGKTFFAAMNCAGCHGSGGTGWVGPSLSDRRWRYGGEDGVIFQSIYYGRPRGMPAFGGVLPPDDIWRILTYLRSLPLPADVPTESW